MDRQLGAEPSPVNCAAAALDRLSSVGLNDLHTWLRPLACLSNGQRERAAVAMRMQSGLAIDDVGATVDERNATVLAAGIARLVRRQKLERVVLTSSKAEVVRGRAPPGRTSRRRARSSSTRHRAPSRRCA